MPRRIPVSPEMVDWLREAHANQMPIPSMASHFNLNQDTIKRILHRHHIVRFNGGKYEAASETDYAMWSRPCSGCGSSKPRPKWTYYCTTCKTRLGHDAASQYD